jgi:hypothetical protein
MLTNVKLYLRDYTTGKLACSVLDHADDYLDAIKIARQRIFLETRWFETKRPIMALVQN